MAERMVGRFRTRVISWLPAAARPAAWSFSGHAESPCIAFDPRPGDARLDQASSRSRSIAVGGQGGGVLTTWIEDLARAKAMPRRPPASRASAQRTGATVYYIEMAPAARADADLLA
jgi:hypothetical protein